MFFSFSRVVSAAYALCAREILSKERFVPCSVRHQLSDKLNLVKRRRFNRNEPFARTCTITLFQVSLLVAVGLPALAGPIVCPIVHMVLTFCNFCCIPCFGRTQQQQQQQQQGSALATLAGLGGPGAAAQQEEEGAAGTWSVLHKQFAQSAIWRIPSPHSFLSTTVLSCQVNSLPPFLLSRHLQHLFPSIAPYIIVLN